jgi:hypothetical protein
MTAGCGLCVSRGIGVWDVIKGLEGMVARIVEALVT